MRNHLWPVVALTASLAACGSKGGGSAEPDGPGKAYTAAFNGHDKEGIRAVHASDELLRKSLQCEDPTIYERAAFSRDRLPDMIFEAFKDTTLEWVDQDLSDLKSLKAGKTEDGCKALVDITMARAQWNFSVTKGGQTEKSDEQVELVKIGDAGWFLLAY